MRESKQWSEGLNLEEKNVQKENSNSGQPREV